MRKECIVSGCHKPPCGRGKEDESSPEFWAGKEYCAEHYEVGCYREYVGVSVEMVIYRDKNGMKVRTVGISSPAIDDFREGRDFPDPVKPNNFTYWETPRPVRNEELDELYTKIYDKAFAALKTGPDDAEDEEVKNVPAL